jgi:uncharacterized protein
MLLKRLLLPNGKQIEAEVVSSPEALHQGLMGRTSLPSDCGMLFVFSRPAKHWIWMANTRIPLDILWLDFAGKIVELAEGQPFLMRRVGGKEISSFALEVARGTTSGVRVGQRVACR